MSKLRICDGCGKPLTAAPAITGNRANGLGGGQLPDADFDWCLDCARVAFLAVRAAHAAKSAPRPRGKS